MKKIKYLAIGTVVALFFITSTVMVKPTVISAAETKKGECYVISIHGKSDYVSTPMASHTQAEIIPESIRIAQGSCVVWVNWADRPEISISFNDGKTCKTVTKAPVGFKLDSGSGCYLTDYLTLGATSSLRFMEVGTYKYELHVDGKIAPIAKGQVAVYKP